MKHILIIITFFFSLNLFAQRNSTIYFKDIEINSSIAIQFLDSVNNLVSEELNSRKNISVNQPYLPRYYNHNEFTERIKIDHIKTDSYRVYMSTSDSLDELQIIAFSQNVVYNQQIPYQTRKTITKEPLFVVPLVDNQGLLTDTDYKKLCEIISNSLTNLLVDENKYFIQQKHLTMNHIFFEDYPVVEQLFDLQDIIYSGIESYSYPEKNDSNIVKNPFDYLIGSNQYYDPQGNLQLNLHQRPIIGLSANMNFNIKLEEKEAAIGFNSAISIAFKNTFLGITASDEKHLYSPHIFHSKKILWFNSEKLKEFVSDPVFNSTIQYALANNLLSKLEINTLYNIK